MAGCRSQTLLGYLKSLAVLRLVGSKFDANARGEFVDSTFVLYSERELDDIVEYLSEEYVPTPILNPWNSGSGFDGKADTASSILDRLRATKSSRFEPYRQTLAYMRETLVESGRRAAFLESKDKFAFLRTIRSSCPTAFLPWLDAALVLGVEKPSFPFILGSGGNDGRLDFAVNFAARVLELFESGRSGDCRALLVDALEDTSTGRLTLDAAIGQFSPRHAGGANAQSGFDAVTLVNPWDYVLMLEGAVMFTGAIGRRSGESTGRPLFPFAFRSIASGYGSASSVEKTRGEIWLPIWRGSASLRSLIDLFRKGRVDMPSQGRASVHPAVLASDAAAAIMTRGVAVGIEAFQRIGFMERNGLAYAATTLGEYHVDDGFDRGIAILSQSALLWVNRLRSKFRTSQSDSPGQEIAERIQAFDDALFAFTESPDFEKALARQELLCTFAEIDDAVSRRSDLDDVKPPPTLSADLTPYLDDETPVHRAALAIASYWMPKNVAEHGVSRYGRDLYLRGESLNEIDVLHRVLDFRMRAAKSAGSEDWLRSQYVLGLSDVQAFLAFGVNEKRRFVRLLRAYRCIDFSQMKRSVCFLAGKAENALDAIPAVYACLKIVFDSPQARDERILRLLFGGPNNAPRGLSLAMRRLSAIKDISGPYRDVSRVRLTEPEWMAASLALPLDWNASYAVAKAVFLARGERASGCDEKAGAYADLCFAKRFAVT